MSLSLTKDLESQNRIKHIDVMYYQIRGLVEKSNLAVDWIPSAMMLIDGLTKALPAEPFKKHHEEWSLVE